MYLAGALLLEISMGMGVYVPSPPASSYPAVVLSTDLPLLPHFLFIQVQIRALFISPEHLSLLL